jgi:phytol kinase
MAIVSAVVSLLVLLSTAGNHWPVWAIAGTIGIVAAGLESCSKLGIDNLTVPIGSAAIAYGLIERLA